MFRYSAATETVHNVHNISIDRFGKSCDGASMGVDFPSFPFLKLLGSLSFRFPLILSFLPLLLSYVPSFLFLTIKTLTSHVSPRVSPFCQQLLFTPFTVFPCFFHGFTSSSFFGLLADSSHARPSGKHA